MPTQAEERLREALRQKLAHAVRYHSRETAYAVISQLDPIQALRTSDSPPLTEDDDLLLGHAVKQYQVDYGLEVGDTLLVHEMGDGNYAVSDVLHDNPAESMPGPEGPPGPQGPAGAAG